MENDIDLRKLSDDGYIRFSIKTKDTVQNEAIHEAYREFCRVHAKNDYTHGLHLLLRSFDFVSNINGLWKAIEDIEERVLAVEDSLNKEEEKEPIDDNGAF
jgi:hypothetical protein